MSCRDGRHRLENWARLSDAQIPQFEQRVNQDEQGDAPPDQLAQQGAEACSVTTLIVLRNALGAVGPLVWQDSSRPTALA